MCVAKVKLGVNDSRGRFKLNHGHINAGSGSYKIYFICYHGWCSLSLYNCYIYIFFLSFLSVNYDPKLFDIVIFFGCIGGRVDHKFST